MAISTLTGSKDQTTQLAVLSEIELQMQSGSKPAAAASAGGTTLSTQAALSGVDGWNPNSFDVRGYRGSGGTYWTGMQLIIEAAWCDPTGCEVTDRFTCNVTVNPGAVTSSFSSNCLYFPDSAGFGNKHFRLWAINLGNIVGQDDTADITGSQLNYLSGDRWVNGTVLTSAVTLWVYLNPYGSYIADGAKTHDADCNVTDNVCVYSY